MEKTGRNRLPSGAIWLVALVTLAVFLPALSQGFLGYDDSVLFENLGWRGFSPDQVSWWFTNYLTGDFKPLVWATFAFDHAFWGLNPWGYHWGNILLHSLNAALFLVLAAALLKARPGALIAGALFFSLHPLRVESVAWVTERKDVLFAFFYLAAVLIYVRGRRRHPSRGLPLRPLSAVCGCAVLSVLAKPQALTLPLVLLLLDRTLLRRWSPRGLLCLKEKLPLFAVSLGAAAVALAGQLRNASLVSLERSGLISRLILALKGCFFYLLQTVCPLNLYPLYDETELFFCWPAGETILSGLVLLLILLLACRFACRGDRVWIFSWAWFCLTILPVSGIFRAGVTVVADRFTYLPSLGLSFLIVHLLDRFSTRRSVRLAAASFILLLALSLLTFRQIRLWRSPLSLWSETLVHNPRAFLAHNNLGIALLGQGEQEAAARHFRAALEIKPDYGKAHGNLALVLGQAGRAEEALAHYRLAHESDPDSPVVLCNLGTACLETGRIEEGFCHLRQALRLAPEDPGTLLALANARLEADQLSGARELLETARRLAPENPEILNSLGVVLAREGLLSQAQALFGRVLEIAPENVEAHTNLGNACLCLGRTQEAIIVLERALRLDPASVEAGYLLASALAAGGSREKARLCLERVLKLDPGFTPARELLKGLRDADKPPYSPESPGLKKSEN